MKQTPTHQALLCGQVFLLSFSHKFNLAEQYTQLYLLNN